MTHLEHGWLRRGLLTALLVLLALPAGVARAQDRPAPDPAARLAATLDLTAEQVALVQQHLTGERASGALWGLAAALAPTLTDEQKATLLTPPERPQRRAERPERKPRTERPERRQRPSDDRLGRAERRAQRTERMQAARESMRAALALTPEQVQALESLREQRREARAERRAERPQPGQLPAGLADILTPEQQEVWQIHRGLARQLFAGHRR